MKKLIFILFISIGTCSAQTSAKPKVDSAAIEQARQQKFMAEYQKLNEFKEWLYENVTAKKYDEFIQLYQVFLRKKYSEWIKQNLSNN